MEKVDTYQYQVLINISHFEAGVDGEVRLTADWEIIGKNDNESFLIKKLNYNEPFEGTDFKSVIKAQSRALGNLSREIAQAIASLSNSNT